MSMWRQYTCQENHYSKPTSHGGIVTTTFPSLDTLCTARAEWSMTTVLWNTQWRTARQDEKQAATSQHVFDAQVCAVLERQVEKFALLQDGDAP